jgi:hypothetical protein
MAEKAADDSVVLNTSRDSDSASVTDDERLERRMRRAVLDPAYLDGNFSDDESHRVLRSSRRDEGVVKEQVAMKTEAAPPVEAASSGTGDSGAAHPLHDRNAQKPSDTPIVAKNIVKKI